MKHDGRSVIDLYEFLKDIATEKLTQRALPDTDGSVTRQIGDATIDFFWWSHYRQVTYYDGALDIIIRKSKYSTYTVMSPATITKETYTKVRLKL